MIVALLVFGCGSRSISAPMATVGDERLEGLQETVDAPVQTPMATVVAEGSTTVAGDTPGATIEATGMPDYRWSQLLGRDAIRPIYSPEFVTADQANYSDDELVMGVAIEGAAKAYPVGVLNSREMVNDELGGTPILVTF